MTLSIITINRNNAAGLEKTMRSVLSQTYKDIEYIIVDGASTDNSVEVIRSLLGKPTPGPSQKEGWSEGEGNGWHSFKSLPLVGDLGEASIHGFWISEPDKGIYNAMNKGIRKATGNYLQFLNSGDCLVNDSVIEKIHKQLLPNIDILVGCVLSNDSKGKERIYNLKHDVSFMTFYRSTLPHTSAFIRKDLFVKYGEYDESLKIVSDWKWYMLSVGLGDAYVAFSDEVVSRFESGGISQTAHEIEMTERQKALSEVVPQRVLSDYSKYSFDIEQMERIKRYPWIYKIVWFIERVIRKIESTKR